MDFVFETYTQSYRALWKWKVPIVIVTLVAGALSFAQIWFNRTFAAETFVIVTPVAAGGDSAKYVPEVFSPKTYRDLLLSTPILNEVLERIVKTGIISEENRPSVDRFMEDFAVEVSLVDQTTRPVTYSPLIKMRAKGKAPELAELKLKTWTDVAIEKANDAARLRVASVTGVMMQKRQDFENQLNTILKAIQEDTAKYDVTVMDKQIEIQVELLKALSESMVKAHTDISGSQKKLESIKQGLSEEKPILELARAPEDAAYWIVKGEGDSAKKDKNGLENKVMVDQQLNPVYWKLKQEEQDTIALLASATAQLESLTAQETAAKARLSEIQSLRAEHTMIQEQLKTQQRIAQGVVEEFSKSALFSEGTLALAQGKSSEDLWTVGLNRMFSSVSVIETSKAQRFLKVSTIMFVAFGLMTGFALLKEVGIPRLKRAFPSEA